MIGRILEMYDKLWHNMAVYDLNMQHRATDGALTFNSILYIDIIAAYPGKYTASHLADLLCVSRPAVTQKINDLEKLGYLFKKQCETDKRMVYLYATEKLTIMRNDRVVIQPFIDKHSPAEIEKFCEMMEHLAEMYIWDSEQNK